KVPNTTLPAFDVVLHCWCTTRRERPRLLRDVPFRQEISSRSLVNTKVGGTLPRIIAAGFSLQPLGKRVGARRSQVEQGGETWGTLRVGSGVGVSHAWRSRRVLSRACWRDPHRRKRSWATSERCPRWVARRSSAAALAPTSRACRSWRRLT